MKEEEVPLRKRFRAGRSRAKLPPGGLAKIQSKCRVCGRESELRHQPPWRRHRLALILFILAGAITPVWFAVMVEIVPYPSDDHFQSENWAAGWVALIFVPGLIIGVVASLFPRVREIKCPSCGESDKLTGED